MNGESNLYVGVRDVESTRNNFIGFAAISIDQIIAADGAKMNGLFEIYNTKGKSTGVLGLKLAITDSSNSITPKFNDESIYGVSYVYDGHCATLTPTQLDFSKEWKLDYTYTTGGLVTYQGIIFECIFGHKLNIG